MAKPLLEVRGLESGYNKLTILKGLNLDAAEGSIVCLIGANGAGKTTTLRTISGLIPARGGSVRFDDQDITNKPVHVIARSKLVQSPEGRQVFPDMTVADNSRLGAYVERNRAEIARREARVLERFPRLKERLPQLAGLLSGGEQQMLAMGRALMAAPRLLLLDEPSMGLAPIFVEEIFEIIASLKREGQSILVVEQNASVALAISDYAYVIENGRIALEGPAGDLARNEKVAAAYLGAS